MVFFVLRACQGGISRKFSEICRTPFDRFRILCEKGDNIKTGQQVGDNHERVRLWIDEYGGAL